MKRTLIVLLLLAMLLQAGCSTVNGLCRDTRTVAELGINATQNSVEKQQNHSIGFAIKEQTRIIRNGDQMRIELTRVD